MPASSEVSRYIKVRRLYRGATGGERENAKSIMDRLEADHPGVKALADTIEAAEAGQPSPVPSSQPAAPTSGLDWNRMAELFGSAVNTARTVAGRVAEVEEGEALAEHVDGEIKTPRNGGVNILLKFSPTVMYRMGQLNTFQRSAFKRYLTEMLDVQLDDIFSALDQPEED